MRRAVRYHRAAQTVGGHALDVGCGEGQDARFLAHSDYQTTGLELTANGVAKTRQLLRDFDAKVWQRDLQDEDWMRDLGTFDLVLAINCLQFLGRAAPEALAANFGIGRAEWCGWLERFRARKRRKHRERIVVADARRSAGVFASVTMAAARSGAIMAVGNAKIGRKCAGADVCHGCGATCELNL